MNKKKLILVIEDEETIASLLKTDLEKLGYDILVAHSGIEGIRRAESENPDMIALDVMMQGLNGIEILKKIKENDDINDIPVVLLSLTGDFSKEESLKLGAIDFLKKPFDLTQLHKRIKEITEKKTVLIVDDDQVALNCLSSNLTSMGYKVLCAHTWQSAVTKAKSQKPDIILMDYILPEKDGLEVTKALKQDPETASIPVIAFSSRIDESINGDKILGVTKFLGKEFAIEDLAKEVHKFLVRNE